MNNQSVRITKKFEFSASHRYWREEWSPKENDRVFGLCTSPFGHGHNYELHVTVEGKIEPTTGMIINLTDLKKHVSTVITQFDHKYLNVDTPYFKNQIPTTENIARVLFDLINQQLQGKGDFRLQRIRLYERHDLYVDVWRGGA
jgi:6-pyruvoyltetrahydropterin/6-carboxytetrahydropterin synthase